MFYWHFLITSTFETLYFLKLCPNQLFFQLIQKVQSFPWNLLIFAKFLTHHLKNYLLLYLVYTVHALIYNMSFLGVFSICQKLPTVCYLGMMFYQVNPGIFNSQMLEQILESCIGTHLKNMQIPSVITKLLTA